MGERYDIAKAVSYKYRVIRAYVRYYLKYSPETIDKMNMRQLAEAFGDLLFVRAGRSRMEPED